MSKLINDKRFPVFYLELCEFVAKKMSGVNIFVGCTVATLDDKNIWKVTKLSRGKAYLFREKELNGFSERLKKEVFRVDLFVKKMGEVMEDNNLMLLNSDPINDGNFYVVQVVGNKETQLPKHATAQELNLITR